MGDSVMHFKQHPVILSIFGSLVVCGNTGLPIMIRLIAWIQRFYCPENKRALDFLLAHPRRCFTHMFPALHTLWLLIVLLALTAFQTLVMVWQDWNSPALKGLSISGVFADALFQAVSTRTAGLNSVNIALLSQGTTFLMLVMMYFSSTPTVVTMRFSVVRGRGGR